MMRSFGLAALALSLVAGGRSLGADKDSSSPPPPWQDQASVYLTLNDTAEVPVQQQSMASSDNRRLAPPSSNLRTSTAKHGQNQHREVGDIPRLSEFGLPLKSAYSVVCALAIAIGAFLLCAWLLRRGSRGMGQTLPAEVVYVLGGVSLAARQFVQLLRVGNKLVLISLTPSGAETITEVTDPVEVDRLVGLCQQSHPHSTSKAFEQVFRQLSREPAPSGFLGEAMTHQSSVPSLDMFRSQLAEASLAK
jgi:flagellar biogenesis protein FliO